MRFPLSSKAKLLHSLSLSSRSLRAGFATRKSSRLPSATSRTSPRLSPSPSIRRPLINQLKTQNSKAGPDQTPPSQVSVSNALRDTKAEDNNLLSPVYLPEDPDGVLNEKHPATSILANSAIVVQRQLELMNVMIGFEQANKYVILDPQGNHVGFIAERDLGMGNMMARQMFSTHRSFTTHVFDKYEKEVLRVSHLGQGFRSIT